ncbi:MAG TPA: hypothetical protein VE962_06140, partial [Actinomycetota bacterium]|nr:hypothetical protein [Actinomycetota bacterium]
MRKKTSSAVALAALGLALMWPGSAVAHPPPGQHGGTDNHLIGSGAFGNIELVGRADLTDTPELVADVAVSPDNQWAFLANWGEPDCAGPESGG